MVDEQPKPNGAAPAVSPQLILKAAATSAIGAQANLLGLTYLTP